MGFPLGLTLANSFLCHHEKRWLNKCPEELRPVFVRRYVDNIFVLFRKEEHLKLFLNYFNLCNENIKFTSEKETNKNSVYRKPTLSGVFSHYDSFIPRGYKLGVIT